MRNMVFKILGLAVLAMSIAGSWLWMEYKAFAKTPLLVPYDGWRYEVLPGASVGSIARDLKAAGLLETPRDLRWMARVNGYAGRVKTGEYEFSNPLSPREFLDKIVSGKVVQYALTVVEGWTFRQLLEVVAGHEKLTHTLTGLPDAEIMVRIGAPELHPEGRFFPDTYRFPKGTTDEEFLRRAFTTMSEHLMREWLSREPGLPLATPDEALILASIIERETGAPSERPAIAGVFVRRLKKGMRLQTDPTVIYGMGASYDGNIRRRDLSSDTPYNTYRIKGLPPTPIALPGKEAIHAALHPEGGNALYFVARGDGSHAFADTLEQHSRNVIKYQVKPFKETASAKKKKK